MWALDPLTDRRLANIPDPDADPTPNRRAQKTVRETTPTKYYAREILGAVAAWGHLPSPLVASICDRIPPEAVEETLALLWQAGALRRYVDCPNCEEIVIWSLRASHSLKRIVAESPWRHQVGFFGTDPEDLSTTDYVASPKLSKHDTAAAAAAFRLSKVLPEGWIFGARDARWSLLLRFPIPQIGATAFRRGSRTGQIERWADFVYVRADGKMRVAVEVTVSQNRSQLAGKARWWGVSIAERGGASKAGLKVVILDAPGKQLAGKAIVSAFPESSGWDMGRRTAALEGVLSANWEDWISGVSTPAAENGWLAYQHENARKKHPVRLASDSFDVGGWADGASWAWENKLLKGAIRCEGGISAA